MGFVKPRPPCVLKDLGARSLNSSHLENPISDQGNGLGKVTQQAETKALALSLSLWDLSMTTHPLLGLTASLSCCLPTQRGRFLFEAEVSWLQNASCLQPRFPYLKLEARAKGFRDLDTETQLSELQLVIG